VALKARLKQALCPHSIWLSDYLPILDADGRRAYADYCAFCGKVEKHNRKRRL
jgi:hypothetical protein